MRYSLELTARPPAASSECLDDHTVAALAEGSLAGAEHRNAIAHAAACRRCRSAVGSIARALADPDIARERSGIGQSSGRRIARIAGAIVPLAAAAVLLVIVWPGAPDQPVQAHRAPTVTATAPPILISPLGLVSEGRRLQWRAVRDADRYRVTLFEITGDVVFEAMLGDTVVQLPDSVPVVIGRTYLWKVEARSGFDRWTGSDMVEFTIGPR